MKTNTAITTKTIVLSLMVLIITILCGILALRQTGQQFYDLCAFHNWKGTYHYTGDFYGDIDCSQLKINLFDNNGWTEICSTYPFSPQPSCKWFCVESCKLINKETKWSCVC